MLEKQAKFTLMIALLIIYAYYRGYRLTFGDAYRDPRVPYGHPNSLHRKRLAVDFNLFKMENGAWKYCTETSDHEELGKFWESLGGSWGGSDGQDGNHYSLAHGGMTY